MAESVRRVQSRCIRGLVCLRWSKRLPRFVSKYWTVGSEHIDAFTRDWFEDGGFFHPPLTELARVLEKMVQFGARGVLLVPDWPGSEADRVMRQAMEFRELVGVRVWFD